MSAPGYQHHLEFLPIKYAGLVLDVALNNGDYPLVVNLLISEVLAYVRIPNVPPIGIIPDSRLAAQALASDPAHPLPIRREVVVVGKVEVPGGEQLFDPFDVLPQLVEALGLRIEVRCKGDQLDALDQIDVRAIQLRDVLLLCDPGKEVIPAYVDDAEDPIYHELLAHGLILLARVGLLEDLAEPLLHHQDPLLLAVLALCHSVTWLLLSLGGKDVGTSQVGVAFLLCIHTRLSHLVVGI